MLCLVVGLLCLGLVRSEFEHPDDAIKINGLIDVQLANVNFLLESRGMNTYSFGDVSLYDGQLKMTNLQLSDLTTMTRKGDAFLWTSSDDTIDATASVGLSKFEITADDLIKEGESYGPVTLVIEDNGFHFRQTTTISEDSCQQHYSELRVNDVTSATLWVASGDMDVTEEVNKDLLPYLNQYLDSDEARQALDDALDSCKVHNGDPTQTAVSSVAAFVDRLSV